MSDSIYVPTSTVDYGAKESSRAMFYVVSRQKFNVLLIATVGLYQLYWFYKNWDLYRKSTPHESESGSNIWPVPRGIFAIFFTHQLFREIKAHGIDDPAVAEWDVEGHATLTVIIMVVSNLVDRLANKTIGSPYTDYLALLLLAPMLMLLLKAQPMINAACGDPSGQGNSKFTAANYVWFALGALFWALVFYGM